MEEATNMRKHLSLAVVAAAALLVASTAQASLIWFTPADATAAAPATLGQYTMTAFGDDARPNGTVSDVTSPLGGVVGFSPDLTHVEVGAGWETWSHGYTGDVYYTFGSTLTLTLPSSTGAFYFFAEPNNFDLFTITAVADDGSGSAQVVNGFSGAKFFGVYSDDFAAIDHIDITVNASARGFAVGEFGIAAVPEPSTLLLMGAGLLATRMRRRKA
jgi:PEP-CTERM motif